MKFLDWKHSNKSHRSRINLLIFFLKGTWFEKASKNNFDSFPNFINCNTQTNILWNAEFFPEFNATISIYVKLFSWNMIHSEEFSYLSHVCRQNNNNKNIENILRKIVHRCAPSVKNEILKFSERDNKKNLIKKIWIFFYVFI